MQIKSAFECNGCRSTCTASPKSMYFGVPWKFITCSIVMACISNICDMQANANPEEEEVVLLVWVSKTFTAMLKHTSMAKFNRFIYYDTSVQISKASFDRFISVFQVICHMKWQFDVCLYVCCFLSVQILCIWYSILYNCLAHFPCRETLVESVVQLLLICLLLFLHVPQEAWLRFD